MTTVENTIGREVIDTSLPLKMPHDHGRGIVSKETEYKKEYPGREGEPREGLKNPDTLNFGELRSFEVTQKKFFYDLKGNPRVAELQENTTGLKLAIKTQGKYGHVFKGKEEPINKYDRGELRESLPQRPGQWVKGNLKRPNLPFDPRTTTGQSYRGQSHEPAKKQDERFDNLKSPKDSKLRDHSAYKRDYPGKTPEKWKVDTLGNMNKDAGKLTDSALENAGWKSKTLSSYNRDYSPNNQRPVSPNSKVYGQDKNMKDLLHQFHNGYYVK